MRGSVIRSPVIFMNFSYFPLFELCGTILLVFLQERCVLRGALCSVRFAAATALFRLGRALYRVKVPATPT